MQGIKPSQFVLQFTTVMFESSNYLEYQSAKTYHNGLNKLRINLVTLMVLWKKEKETHQRMQMDILMWNADDQIANESYSHIINIA